MLAFKKQPPDNGQPQIIALLKVLYGFAESTAHAITIDFLKLLGLGVRFIKAKKPEKLLKQWQRAYLEKQARLTELIWLYKQDHRQLAESRNEYCDLITLVNSKTQSPVHEKDQAPKLIPLPEFEDEGEHKYHAIEPGTVSNEAMEPDVKKLGGKSPRLIGALVGIVNRLGSIHTRSLTDQLHFRSFPEKLPKVTNLVQRPLPIRKNVLASLTGFYGHVILLLYLFTVLAEAVIFVSLGKTVLHMEDWKAILFSGILLGVSYLIALLVYDPIYDFLRSRKWVPWVYWVFLTATFVFVLAGGFLNYQSLTEDLQRQAYLTEIQSLESLQMAVFMNPSDPALADELANQQALLDEMGADMRSENSTKSIVSRLLFLVIGFMSLLTSSMLLAAKVVIGKARKLNKLQLKAEKGIISIQSEYEHLLSTMKKARELMTIYCHELGRYMALKTLMVSPPALAEFGLMATSQSAASRGIKTSKKPTKKAPAPQAEIVSDNPSEELLNAENYDQLYSND